MIKIIEQSTDERMKETQELFNKVKPFLDEGYSYDKALKKAGLMTANSWKQRAYTREIVEYAKKQGY